MKLLDALLGRPSRPPRAIAAAVACFHCGLRMDTPADNWVVFDGARHPVCCAGCAAVFDLMQSLGHAEYYRERESERERGRSSAAAHV